MGEKAEANQPHTIQADVPCLGCGYNLRSVALQGECPECGKPVAHSLVVRHLRFSRPNWIQCLRRGLNAFWFSLTFAGLAFAAGFFDLRLCLGLLLIAVGLFITSLWLMTMPEPIREKRGYVARTATRGLALSVHGLGTVAAIAAVSTYAPGDIDSVVAVTLLLNTILGPWTLRLAMEPFADAVDRVPQGEVARNLKHHVQWVGLSIGASVVLVFMIAILAELEVVVIGLLLLLVAAAGLLLLNLGMLATNLYKAQQGLAGAWKQAMDQQRQQRAPKP